MDEHTDQCPKIERLKPMMNLVRKTADVNSAYLDQVRADLQQAHQLSERIQRMKRQDLALLVRRFQTSLERKLDIASGMLGDFCTMVVLHGWVLSAHHDAREEYLLCMDLLFQAHDDTFAWAKNPTETPHPAGGRLRSEVAEGVHQRINIHAPYEAPSDSLASSDVLNDVDDPFLQGLSHMVSEAEEKAASHQRIEAMIDMIESMSYSFGEPSQTLSGAFHARRLASSMRLHQLSSPLVESNAASGLLGGDE
jgi:hypothetical protein